MESGWKDVENEMPELSGFYIVTIRNGSKFEVNTQCRFDSSTKTFQTEDYVLAWQNIPEPFVPIRKQQRQDHPAQEQ